MVGSTDVREDRTPHRRLHIAHLTSVHGVFDSRIFYKECWCLAEVGHRVSLIAVHDRDEVCDGIEIMALPRPRGRIDRAIVTASLVLWRALRLNADVYHFHDPELVPVGLLLRLTGKRVVYDVHEDVPMSMLAKTYLPRAAAIPLSHLTRWMHVFADRALSAIVVVTPDVARPFRAPVMVRNYPRLEEFSDPGCPYLERAEICVYLGAIVESRGSQRMQQVSGLIARTEGRRMILAGPMRDPELAEQLAAGAGGEALSYVGEHDRDGVHHLLNSARVGIFLPQPSNPAYLTAYPIKLFEYMAAGIPVVMANFTVLVEIVEGAGCGLTVDPTDTEAVAGAITWLLDNPLEAKEMGRRGRKAVEDRYNFAAEADRLRDLYLRLTT